MYYLWLYECEGCDYTIGCGQKVIVMRSNTLEEAYVEARERISEYGADRITNAIIYTQGYNINWIVDEVNISTKKEQEEFVLLKKREQLEKLKKELGEK